MYTYWRRWMWQSMHFMSVVPSVAGVCFKQHPSAVLGPPGLDSRAASFAVLWISNWHFGKVTPQLILSNPFHGHRFSHPSIHLASQTMQLHHPWPCPLPPSPQSLTTKAHHCLSPICLYICSRPYNCYLCHPFFLLPVAAHHFLSFSVDMQILTFFITCYF